MHSSVSSTISMQNLITNLPPSLPSYNSRFCPDPYCVCTQSTTSTISGTITSDSIVNVYAATSGAPVCPTAGAAVSEAGCQIVVESKTDSTCGTVVFNTDFCLPSSMVSTSSSSTPIQISSASQALRQEYQPVATTTAQAPVITPGPSYKILCVNQCLRPPRQVSAYVTRKKIR